MSETTPHQVPVAAAAWALALCLAMLGGGEWSVDHGLDLWDDLSGWTGLAIAAIAGGGGAALLLAVFWRPERKPDAA